MTVSVETHANGMTSSVYSICIHYACDDTRSEQILLEVLVTSTYYGRIDTSRRFEHALDWTFVHRKTSYNFCYWLYFSDETNKHKMYEIVFLFVNLLLRHDLNIFRYFCLFAIMNM